MTSRLDLLLKDELQYELSGRGVMTFTSKSTVEDLRKLVRLHKNIPFEAKNLEGKILIKNELELLQTKISDLEQCIKELDTKAVPKVLRAETKLTHLYNRCKTLSCFKNEKGETPQEECKSLLVQLDVLKAQLETIVIEDTLKESTYRKMSASLLEDDELNNVFFACSENSVSNELTNKSVSTVNIVSQDTNNHVSNPCPVPSSLFCKLENPMNNYLRKFRPTNGLNLNELLDFLKTCLQLQEEMTVPSAQIYELALSYARGPLLNKMLEAKNHNIDFKQFHQNVFSSFVPVGLLENLKRNLINRPQKCGEALSLYIYGVKMYAKLLLCNYSEKDLVEIIKFGICPEDRAKLVFHSNPSTFKELDSMCVQVQNFQYMDHVRLNVDQPVNRATPQYVNNVQGQPAYVPRGAPKCFTCGRPGHKSYDCYYRNQASGYKQKNL